MNEQTERGAAATEEKARQVVCQRLAEMVARGYGQFRIRWMPHEERVLFQGEKDNKWESVDGADYYGEDARSIAGVLAEIRNKRNAVIEITARKRSDQEIFVIRPELAALQTHGRSLESFLHGQLFWD